MNKFALLLLPFLLLCFQDSAFALNGRNCEDQVNRLKITERDRLLKSCLAQLGSPANVRELAQTSKKMICEQNAKNKKLPSNQKGEYMNECINRNEAADVAKAIATKNLEQSAPQAHASANAQRPKQAALKHSSVHKKPASKDWQ